MSERLFDQVERYDQMLRQGLRLSGEDKQYFIRGRIADLQARLPQGWQPKRVLDFGCGIGDTCPALAKAFPQAVVVGADVSQPAVARAAATRSSARVLFCEVEGLADAGPFDLCHVNGAFHHIEPDERPEALRLIHQVLGDLGYLALFENNPWNPGARLVMRRIPFDRGARMLAPSVARRLVQVAGFSLEGSTRSLFYFPRPLAGLRFLELHLARVPLGAQYYVLARKLPPG